MLAMKKKTMRSIISITALSLAICLISPTLTACNNQTTMYDNARAEESKLDVALLSDLHYVSPTLIESPSVESFAEKSNDLKTFAISSAIIQTALDNIVESGVKYIFISGDLSDSHALINHTELADLYSQVESKGIQVFVAPGNHDVAEENGYEGWRYTSIGTERVDDFYNQCVDNETGDDITIKSQFKEIYNDFGYSEAIEVNGLNYVANVGENYRLIVLDNCSSDLTTDIVNWAETQVKDAILADKTPLMMMHKPIDNIFDGLATVMNLVTGDSGKLTTAQPTLLTNKLAKAGLKFVFTGHNHANNICTLKTTDETETIYDIMTASLTQVDNSYRQLRFSENYFVGKIQTIFDVNEEYLPEYLNATEKEDILQGLKLYSYDQMENFLENILVTNNDTIKNFISEAILGEGVEPPEGFDAFVQSGILDLATMPFYRSKGGDASIEALYEKYGATLPESDYENVLQLVAAAMNQVFMGGESKEGSESIISMFDATIKAIIVNVIDKGLFTFSDKFLTIPEEEMYTVCSNLLQKGEFELLNSRILNNILQLPVMTELNNLIAVFPSYVVSAEEFANFISTLEIAGILFNMELEPYFQSTVETIDGEEVKTYTGLFYSDKCLEEQFFDGAVKNLVDDGDIPDRYFAIDLRTFEYQKIN